MIKQIYRCIVNTQTHMCMRTYTCMNARIHTQTPTHTKNLGGNWRKMLYLRKLWGYLENLFWKKNKQTEHEQIQMYKSLRNLFLVESTQTSCYHNLTSQNKKNKLSKTRFRKALN